MQSFTISTQDGRGEATKEDRDQPWLVSLPAGSFSYFGSIPQVRAEIKRVLKLQYPKS